ncbi:hypothetical protein [Azospirillum soli]|uniref:hypothetical protein n=1 Tax=Azospirillum soli TaxID=1304799 RepID=UPI001AE5DD94|nr:hypothetical protein [Azospirillum soli]MBP2315739.1 hypothetical protein [Azospirillum soli]
MRLHEIMGITKEQWHQHLAKIGLPDATVDAASRQADQMVKRGKLAKKRAAVMKAQKALADRQRDLAATSRDA